MGLEVLYKGSSMRMNGKTECTIGKGRLSILEVNISTWNWHHVFSSSRWLKHTLNTRKFILREATQSWCIRTVETFCSLLRFHSHSAVCSAKPYTKAMNYCTATHYFQYKCIPRYNNNNDFISIALFHAKHAQLR